MRPTHATPHGQWFSLVSNSKSLKYVSWNPKETQTEGRFPNSKRYVANPHSQRQMIIFFAHIQKILQQLSPFWFCSRIVFFLGVGGFSIGREIALKTHLYTIWILKFYLFTLSLLPCFGHRFQPISEVDARKIQQLPRCFPSPPRLGRCKPTS